MSGLKLHSARITASSYCIVALRYVDKGKNFGWPIFATVARTNSGAHINDTILQSARDILHAASHRMPEANLKRLRKLEM